MRPIAPLLSSLLLAASIALPGQVVAEDTTLILEYENDLFGGDDRWYTNGVRATWMRTGRPGLLYDLVTLVGERSRLVDPGKPISYSFSLGQNMYTPKDITDPDPPEDDRPYAGWLNVSTGLGQLRSDSLTRVMVTVGMVGPASLAKRTQKEVHRLIDTDMPRGWDTQLRNEPTLMVSAERIERVWEMPRVDGWGADLNGHLGLALGTPFTLAGTGLTLRLGRHMPNDFSPPRIQPAFPGSMRFVPAERWGWYVFTGIDGQGRARDVFLDGNTYRRSRSVRREPWVAEATVGLAVANRWARLAYTHAYRTREFKGQPEDAEYGSLSLSVRW
ncbi:lipid A deacylase LpxR family protein [Alkalilimnicola ehrlichii MLHE-1]|uniref:Outer membrane protein n=1 Tax=Alkalilimnicola ehrlichii (strain ATCC BAA-1101 / DSM 17681 / MLHE-1) TaxID=187272 RepID=Q0A9E9_ALKEH|nr:lipid A deacylase LpxR family protein [Alkalilimnicola ehrlichii]ABI56538.1 outer membrane protein [Alkalilimnicola ehrlichii MLHE-1]